ncbi:hypothetical protein M422DRAFT_261150 [Sphaerobolus stellatus SS14]|uniref:Uncharacterized protein n=1 Tax=Sphaerobolus stellatus (strain SS14) TaxID=990650 RepID=A0A0C9UNM0_SPHS4|nr:hypothetical protein M422DRAFT_261150 [Sphaerobolus stellatus SS14]
MQFGIDDLAKFFIQNPNLVECFLNYVDGDIHENFDASSLPEIPLSNLKCMRLSYGTVSADGITHVNNEYLSPLMASLQMSALDSLHLNINSSKLDIPFTDRNMAPNFPDGLLTCLSKSLPPLRKLVFVHIQVSTDALLRLLLLVPQLESLTLAYFSNHDALELLDITRYPAHVPELKFLSLRSSRIAPPVAERIIIGRQDTLRCISFEGCHVIVPTTLRWRADRSRANKRLYQLLHKFRQRYPKSILAIKTPLIGYYKFWDDMKTETCIHAEYD